MDAVDDVARFCRIPFAVMRNSIGIPRYLFDKKDFELIQIVNDVLNRAKYTRKQYFPYFHPNGIKQMAETKGLRSAYAVAQLLSSLEIGGMDDRINALRSLRLEVIDTAEGPMPKNTARVLLQIMKELVRAHGNTLRQLELAHDFRTSASGKPRVIRRQLKRYHLLEMPEEWNQVAFDDHVHDVNTKGRKSPTHLIMDAWIKGIRCLRIIHYNFIEPRFAAELFEAAKIMNIDVRIGIEFSARFRNKYVQLIWVPRGFGDAQSFLCFLAEPAVMKIMEAGRQASQYQQEYVIDLLKKFNAVHRLHVNRRFGIDLPEIDLSEFLAFVGIGQKSKLHLSKFIQEKLIKILRARAGSQGIEGSKSAAGDQTDPSSRSLSGIDLEKLVDGLLDQNQNPEITYPDHPSDDPDVPELLRLTPNEILSRLAHHHSGYRVTLNLTNLKVQDVLELLYDCQGTITRLEIFNLKDHAAGKTKHIADICRLMQAINDGSVIHLKYVIREIIDRLQKSAAAADSDQAEKLTSILYDIDSFKAYYSGKPIKARIGSDSTGRSTRLHGMGIAIMETLPSRARKGIRRDCRTGIREIIPVQMTACMSLSFIPESELSSWFGRFLSRIATAIPLTFLPQSLCRWSWRVEDTETRIAAPGNLVTLGGAQKEAAQLLLQNPNGAENAGRVRRFSYLHSDLKKLLKVSVGFVPAFLTFALTNDWWLLAYLGALIWFGITGMRNVLQSVLGGGGFRRSPLMNWNDYVSWSRITDSLMFTGFSVPLLEYFMKTVVLDRGFGITAGTHPIQLYTFMALTNGIYLSSHNLLRGLPRGAVYGNFFRSIISIPLALLLNTALGNMLGAAGVVEVSAILQKWAAIISKTASDIVAGFIEGMADRHRNIQGRLRDYKVKFEQLFDTYAQLELLYPQHQTSEILPISSEVKQQKNGEARDLEKIIMIHALDLLYFWMYQPRSQTALRRFVGSLSEDERHILASSQFTLLRQREISRMFIDGILGDDFARTLSFYLSRYSEYLVEIKNLIFGELLLDYPESDRPEGAAADASALQPDHRLTAGSVN